MRLVDFKVRVINDRAGDRRQGPGRGREPGRRRGLGTVGVSGNMIQASWMALVDAFDYKLAKETRARPAKGEAIEVAGTRSA